VPESVLENEALSKNSAPKAFTERWHVRKKVKP
jgi:hypothetical protein